MNTLSVKNLSTYSAVNHINLGKLKVYCQEFDINGLQSGINLLEGPLNSSSWCLTNCLCNKNFKISDVEGEFYIDNKSINLREIRSKSYYVLNEKMTFFSRYLFPYVKQYIKNSNDEIYDLLLQERILDRKICNLGNWKYIVSFYKGYQKGNEIFGFPWLFKDQVEIQGERLRYIHEFSKKNQLCILIPCEINSQYFLEWEGFAVRKIKM